MMIMMQLIHSEEEYFSFSPVLLSKLNHLSYFWLICNKERRTTTKFTRHSLNQPIIFKLAAVNAFM